jgi:isoquinoline 1-oxidoreductase beta subunit
MYSKLTFTINGTRTSVSTDSERPLLWVLREALGLTGTKYGCGVGVCGICTILVDGEAKRACVVPASQAAGRRITTIEGLAGDDRVVQAWIAEQAPQCGYCQPGQIMAATALLARTPHPSDRDIDAALSGVLCRCAAYQRIRRAVRRAAATAPDGAPEAPAAAVESHARRHRFDPWVAIAEDGTVWVTVDRSEMGQGANTSLALLVAEELNLPLRRLRTEFAPAARRYYNPRLGSQMTGGSTSTRGAWGPLRAAAASVRERLLRAAAAAWKVPLRECVVDDGSVLHRPSGRRAGFGRLARAASRFPAPRRPRPKDAGEFRLLGTAVPRLEVPDLARGRALFGIDVARPDMLCAVVARCPEIGGRAARWRAGDALRVPGVRKVLEIDSGVAVVADDAHAALRGRDALRIEWESGGNADLDDAAIRARMESAALRRGKTWKQRGDTGDALRGAARVIAAVYETPYLAHGTLEPMNCVAEVSKDRCDLWTGTQWQTGAQAAAAEITGLPKRRVHVNTTFLGGGFGRRLEVDFVREAVQIAKAAGAPVKLLWTRDDDMQHDFYRPASYTLLRAGLDRTGMPVAWEQRIVGPSEALINLSFPYAVPNLHIECIEEDPGVPTGAWRSVGASQNAFTVECFADELAAAGGRDPVALRVELLRGSPRQRAVIERAAAAAGWNTPPATGHHRGVAAYSAFGSHIAEVAEVSVDPGAGEVRVHRVVVAIDCGQTVNRDGLRAQIEGGVGFGLSAALRERISIRNGRVQQSTFEDYPLLTIEEMPEVEVHITDSHEEPGGVGEPPVPPIAPAVANAVSRAIGCRVRALPVLAHPLLRRGT